MEWKEVCKVSFFMGILSFFAVNSSDYTNIGQFVSQEAFETVAFLGGILITGLILTRRLKSKSDWGIVVGAAVAWLTPLVLQLLISFWG